MQRINMLPQGGPLPGMGQGLGRLNRQRVQQGLSRVNQDGSFKMRGGGQPQPMPTPIMPMQRPMKQPMQPSPFGSSTYNTAPDGSVEQTFAPGQPITSSFPPNPQMAGQALGLLNAQQAMGQGYKRPMPMMGQQYQPAIGNQIQTLQGQMAPPTQDGTIYNMAGGGY